MEDKKSELTSGMEMEIPMFKGFWIRVLAALIDYLLISFGTLIILIKSWVVKLNPRPNIIRARPIGAIFVAISMFFFTNIIS